METDKIILAKIQEVYDRYEKEVEDAEKQGYLKPNTTRTYLLHSGNFVKWCKGEFDPGCKNKSRKQNTFKKY